MKVFSLLCFLSVTALADLQVNSSVFTIVPTSVQRELANEGKGLAFLAGNNRTLWTTATNFTSVLGQSLRDTDAHFVLYDHKKKVVWDTKKDGVAKLELLGTFEAPGEARQNYVRLTLPKEISGIALPWATTAPTPGDILKVVSEETNTIRVGQAMGRKEVKQISESHGVAWEETLFSPDLVYIDYPCDRKVNGGPVLTAQGAVVGIMVKGAYFNTDHKGYCWGVSTKRIQALNQLKPVR